MLNLSVRSSYPEVIVESMGPYCDCRLQKYLENPGGMCIGPHYCPKHKVIILEGIYMPEDLETIPETAVYLINHETLHWLLCRYFDESTSRSLDDVDSIPPLI